MLVITFTLVLFVQVGCEWVQISQQLYKKPLRPATDHPLLATVIKSSETTHPTISIPPSATVKTSDQQPNEDHAVSPVVKVFDVERTTKRNRIYINHTHRYNSWDTSIIDFNEQHDLVSRKPPLSADIIMHEPKSKGDILIIRRPKPDENKNNVKTGKAPGHQTPIPGNVMRVHPANNKESSKTPKPLEEYKGPIEVLNMADLEYTTAEDTFNIKLDKDIKNNGNNKQVIETSTTPKEIHKRKMESSKKSDQRKQARPNHEHNAKEPAILKGITNMRRVEILRSTKPTHVEEYDNIESKNLLTSQKPESNSEKRNINRDATTEKTPFQFPSIGYVKRVNSINTTKPTRKPKPTTKYSTSESVNDEENSSKQGEEIVTNIPRTDKPLRKNTTEKTHPVRTKPTLKNRDQNRKMPSPEDAMLEELITEDEKQFAIKLHKVASIGSIKRVPNPAITPEANKNKMDRHDSMKQPATPTLVEDFDEQVTVEDEYAGSNFKEQYKNNDYATSTEELPIHATPKSKPKLNAATRRPEINPQIERYGPNPYKPIRPSKMPGYVINGDDFEHDAEFYSTTESNRKANRNNIKTEATNQHNTRRKDNHFKSNTAKGSKLKQFDENVNKEEDEEEPLSNDKKNIAMENLIKFLKTVTEIIARNTRRGVHGKLRYLEDLRDTLMANIEDRIEAAFPDDPTASPVPGARRERSAEPRGHVEFPSSEGALMTISFLTFAVFLVKLVLQVIQAYKNKTMMMMPTVVAAVGRAYNGRRTNN